VCSRQIFFLAHLWPRANFLLLDNTLKDSKRPWRVTRIFFQFSCHLFIIWILALQSVCSRQKFIFLAHIRPRLSLFLLHNTPKHSKHPKKGTGIFYKVSVSGIDLKNLISACCPESAPKLNPGKFEIWVPFYPGTSKFNWLKADAGCQQKFTFTSLK